MSGEDLFQNQRVPWLTFDPTAAGSITTPPDAGDVRLYVDPTTLVLSRKDSSGNITPLAAVNNFAGTAPPDANDDDTAGYGPGSVWVDVTNDKAYVCLDGTTATAVWKETTQATGGAVTGTPHEEDYVEFTSTVAVTATVEGSANTVVTAGAVAFDGSTVGIIEFFASRVTPETTAGVPLKIIATDGGTVLGIIANIVSPAAAGQNIPIHVLRRLTPSNASHTFDIRAYTGSGQGDVYAGAGGATTLVPGFIRISKLAT